MNHFVQSHFRGQADCHGTPDSKETELSVHPNTVASNLSSRVDEVEGDVLERDESEQSEKSSVCEPQLLSLRLQRWCFLVLIGFLACSYWRGMWALFDIYSCDQSASATLLNGELFCLSHDVQNPMRQNSALMSFGIGLSFTSIGKFCFWAGLFFRKGEESSFLVAGRRVLMVQVMGMGCVFTWRGLWMLIDAWLYPGDALKSGWISATVGYAGCLLLCCTAALSAAPTGLLQDPANETFETIGSLIRQGGQPPALSTKFEGLSLLTLGDLAVSYILLPIFACNCWRGIWALEDYYLWGDTESKSDLICSLWIGTLVFVACITMNRAIEVAANFSPCNGKKSTLLLHLTNRIQNAFCGVASVSFWRVIWYAWEDLTGPSALSAWVAYILGMIGLVTIGAFADVTFPPSVDFLGTDDFASQTANGLQDEPLKIGLRWFGILR